MALHHHGIALHDVKTFEVDAVASKYRTLDISRTEQGLSMK